MWNINRKKLNGLGIWGWGRGEGKVTDMKSLNMAKMIRSHGVVVGLLSLKLALGRGALLAMQSFCVFAFCFCFCCCRCHFFSFSFFKKFLLLKKACLLYIAHVI